MRAQDSKIYSLVIINIDNHEELRLPMVPIPAKVIPIQSIAFMTSFR